jgi:hypothetical protein
LASSDLPPNVQLLLEQIETLEGLEIVLLLQRTPSRGWPAVDVAQELRITAESAGSRLTKLMARGFATATGEGSERSYQFAPSTPELAKDVADLAAAYATARLTVINHLASRQLDQIRSFANAFKLRGGH